ncbi:tumor necrosis factor receptor superfamily member 5 isoform X1 [Corythoichthys intestinalis]|uniref:tumor necrosis factor receptor superfamily member 5 isoform X1 n=1 Tax=Corythoichthys intestinalis TaxID=161448 RepID=UPI0025A61276|nr:tumor necrosis factor receptor superfamily member 5 isoform X1 [Corythoichthys intestinalis]
MLKCNVEDMYRSQAGKCCNRCPPGSFVAADCDHNNKTWCEVCRQGLYTATKNHLRQCRVCRSCSASNNQITQKECAPNKDTVCKCASGYFCSGDTCDHCMLGTSCPLGSGVKVEPSGANDTICTPCVNGTYSNVSDSYSACQTHTRCEDLGRVLRTAGTSTSDAICGEFKSGCPWILPAGLWLGFVLTLLIVLLLMCWMTKRKSHKMSRSNAAIHDVRNTPEGLPEPPPPTPKIFDQDQKSDFTQACQFTLLNMDKCAEICSRDHNEDLPLALKTNSWDHHNGTEAYHRSHSEPQEDEWCGT